ncbi:envelope stress response membrane protein PspC [Parapedomonas caeni]
MISRTKFYLDKRNGKLMGVCAGFADYFGIDVMWVRVAVVLLTLFAGGWPILIYPIIGIVADAKPRELYDIPADEQAFWRRVRTSPSVTIRDTRGSFRDIDRRLRDVEAYMTSSNRSLSAEIDRLR